MNDVKLTSYADYNTPFFVGDDLRDVTLKLQNASKALFKWFSDNQMKANQISVVFIYSSSVKTSIMIEEERIRNSSCEKLFCVFLYSKLTFSCSIFPNTKKMLRIRTYVILIFGLTLKSDSHLLEKFCFICFIKSPLKMMKNAFCFILKALFVLKIFKFLS